jgi:hypothetical protein
MPGFIHALRKAGATYRNLAKKAFGEDLFLQIDEEDEGSFLFRLIRELGEVNTANALRGTLNEQVKVTFARLSTCCSHFHQVLDMAIQRDEFQAGARGFYDRDIHATTIPVFASQDGADEAASAIVAGESRRQLAEGTAYIPMALPSAATVAALQAQFAALRDRAQTASVNINQEQEDVGALFDQARALVIEIWNTVEFFYRHDLDPGSRRDKCAEWGVIYVSNLGEMPEPPPVDPPTP